MLPLCDARQRADNAYFPMYREVRPIPASHVTPLRWFLERMRTSPLPPLASPSMYALLRAMPAYPSGNDPADVGAVLDWAAGFDADSSPAAVRAMTSALVSGADRGGSGGHDTRLDIPLFSYQMSSAVITDPPTTGQLLGYTYDGGAVLPSKTTPFNRGRTPPPATEEEGKTAPAV